MFKFLTGMTSVLQHFTHTHHVPYLFKMLSADTHHIFPLLSEITLVLLRMEAQNLHFRDLHKAGGLGIIKAVFLMQLCEMQKGEGQRRLHFTSSADLQIILSGLLPTRAGTACVS